MSTENFKGTPAPWYATEFAGFWQVSNEPYYTSTNLLSYDEEISKELEYETLTPEQARANAHLMAASPDLLTAAINALDLVTRLWNNESPINYNEYCNHHDELSSAIHKALTP